VWEDERLGATAGATAMLRNILFCTLAASLLGAPLARADSFDTKQQAEIGAVVRAYLLEHPEVILEAIDVLKARQAEKEQASQSSAIVRNKAALFAQATDPVVGNPQGDVTLIEFLDYQCGYCKSVWQPLADVVQNDGKVRVIFKDFPILGPASVIAARAALAAREQGKYAELHDALMAYRGRLDEETILRIAKGAGIDVALMQKRMADPAIQAQLDANLQLAHELGINGTPAFIVGDTLFPGALPAETLKQIITEARDKG
jgi:protein-disulfide isomerase